MQLINVSDMKRVDKKQNNFNSIALFLAGFLRVPYPRALYGSSALVS